MQGFTHAFDIRGAPSFQNNSRPTLSQIFGGPKPYFYFSLSQVLEGFYVMIEHQSSLLKLLAVVFVTLITFAII